jgi:hypothetical protein
MKVMELIQVTQHRVFLQISVEDVFQRILSNQLKKKILKAVIEHGC